MRKSIMLTIQKLEHLECLTPNEKLVADYLTKNQNKMIHLSVPKISRDTFTSPSTTVRLAQKLGFHGWKELKNSLIEELTYINSSQNHVDPNMPFDENDSFDIITNSIAKLLCDSILDTVHLINQDELEKIVHKIDNAKNIYIYGYSTIISSLQHFKIKMRSIGKMVTIIIDTDQFPYYIDLTDQYTCSIFVSYSGESEALIKQVKELRLLNYDCIAITSIGGNTLSKLADITLPLSTREKLYSKISDYSSHESVHFIFELLFSCFYSLNYNYHYQHNVQRSQKLDYERISTVQILKEND